MKFWDEREKIRREALEEGRAEERAETEKERARADEAKKRAAKAEEKAAEAERKCAELQAIIDGKKV